MIRPFLLFALLAAPAAAVEPSPPAADNIRLTPGPVASKALYDTLLQRDRELFDAIYTTCDADALAPLVTEDFEFFHDKWGQNANSGAEFVASIRAMCERRRSGEDFVARRELDANSVSVHAINNYGAMQMGTHRFYAVAEEKPDRLTEVAKFIDLWKLEEGVWKLARVISYDHRLAELPAAD